MDEWIDRMAETLTVDPITPGEMGAILKLAREVAHGVERKLAPVSTFLAGVYAGRQAEGATREEAAKRAIEAALALIPPQPNEGATPAGAEG
jgi:hypothetical protein